MSARRTLIIGVDPGLKGAVGVLEHLADGTSRVVDIFDMPLVEVPGGKFRIDLYQLALLVERYTPETVLAVIEEVGFMKGKEARGTAFTFGYATGAVTGILAGLMVSIQTVIPAVWKPSLGLASSSVKTAAEFKVLSIEKAKAILPGAEKFLTKKKHDGRAEAILLAYWGLRELTRRRKA